MNDVSKFRLSGNASVINLRTGHNATLTSGLVVLSETAHYQVIAALEADNERLRAELASLRQPVAECDTCHGQGEVWTGKTAYQGHLQPPEPIMDTCPECSGESIVPAQPASPGISVDEQPPPPPPGPGPRNVKGEVLK